MPIQEYGQSATGSYAAPKRRKTTTPTYDPVAKTYGGLPLSVALQIAPAGDIFKRPSAPSIPSLPQTGGGFAPQMGGMGMGMPSGFMDLYKMLLGEMMGGMQMPQLPAYPDIQGMLKEAQTAAFQQATTQKGIATRKIGEQSEETLKGISEIEDEEKRFAALDAAARGVYESGLLTQALAKSTEKFGTAKTKVLTEKQSALDALEAALLGIKSSSTMQGLPMMQQAWQNQYAASMNMAQNQWQQRQSGMQNALQLYQMQLQDQWRRQGAGQTYTSPSQYMGGQEGIVNQLMNMFSGQGFPEQLGFGGFTGLGV